MKAGAVLLCSLLLPAALCGLWFQHHALIEARADHSKLLADAGAAQRLSREARDLAALRQDHGEIEKLRAENRYLYALRNEVRQLRDQVKQLGALRNENLRLRAAGTARPAAKTGPGADARPFLALTPDELHFAGYATPEATLQTFFWTVQQHDLESLKRCLTPDAQRKMTEKSTDALRSDVERLLKDFAGVRVVARKSVSNAEVQLGVQVSWAGRQDPEETALPFQFVGNEWRLDFVP